MKKNELNEIHKNILATLLAKHQYGQKKYKTFSFLEREMFEEMESELVDTINYAVYQIIKLRHFKENLRNIYGKN